MFCLFIFSFIPFLFLENCCHHSLYSPFLFLLSTLSCLLCPTSSYFTQPYHLSIYLFFCHSESFVPSLLPSITILSFPSPYFPFLFFFLLYHVCVPSLPISLNLTIPPSVSYSAILNHSFPPSFPPSFLPSIKQQSNETIPVCRDFKSGSCKRPSCKYAHVTEGRSPAQPLPSSLY